MGENEDGDHIGNEEGAKHDTSLELVSPCRPQRPPVDPGAVVQQMCSSFRHSHPHNKGTWSLWILVWCL